MNRPPHGSEEYHPWKDASQGRINLSGINERWFFARVFVHIPDWHTEMGQAQTRRSPAALSTCFCGSSPIGSACSAIASHAANCSRDLPSSL